MSELTLVQEHILNWLSSPYAPDFTPEPWLYSMSSTRVLHRVAFLVSASEASKRNGRVSWGAIHHHTGPYGRTGLSQTEALELIYFYGYRDALVNLAPKRERDNTLLYFSAMVQSEIGRVAQERNYQGDGDEDDYIEPR